MADGHHVLSALQPEASGRAVHEGHPQQGERGPRHRQSRHVDPEGEGAAEAQGTAFSPPPFRVSAHGETERPFSALPNGSKQIAHMKLKSAISSEDEGMNAP